MARLYDDNNVKLNNVQATEVLMNEMPISHKQILKPIIEQYTGDGIPNFRKIFAHAVLDCYRNLPTENGSEEKSKKFCKYLMDKYMKSSTPSKDEESVMQLLISSIKGE